MAAYNQVTYDDQILESIVVTHYDQIFNRLLLLLCVSSSRVQFVVVPLDDQVFDSGCYFYAIVMSVDGEVLDVVSYSLVAVVLVDGVGILMRLLLLLGSLCCLRLRRTYCSR